MKLSNRVWLVIVPVVMFAYSGAFFLVYQAQRHSYQQLEQSRVDAQLERVRAAFEHDHAALRQYAQSLTQSPVLQQAMLAVDADLIEHAGNRALSTVVRNLQTSAHQQLEVTLVDAEGNQRFFYSAQPDPFSEPHLDLRQSTHTAQRDRVPTLDRFWFDGETMAHIMVWNFDPATLQPPVGHRWDDNVSLSIMMSYDTLNSLVAALDQGPDFQVFWPQPQTAQPLIGIWNDIALTPARVLQLQRNPDQVRSVYHTLAWRLILIVVLLSICTSFLLGALIQRFITTPVALLEHSLKQLPGFTPSDTPASLDEVASLSHTIHELNAQREHAFQKVKLLAETDSLTELVNRRMFSECVEGLIGRARHGDRFGLLYIDLDNFKFINDSYGHETGDQVLKEFARQLKSTLRLTDVVMSVGQDISRLAGDEFAVIVHGDDVDAALPSIAGRILKLFETGFQSQCGNLAISASIGIAVFPDDADTADQLISRADAAMYQAKHHGKNQYTFYSQELADKALRQQRIEANLKLKRFEEFSMYYMPLYSADTLSIKGVEALLRWHSSELGFVSPAEFIPIAESKGLFMDLDMWVINKVIDDLPVLRQALGEQGKVAINISSAHLASHEFFYEVVNTTTRRNVDRQQIELEITETFGAEMTERVIANLSLFKQAGFSLALDDFGSGYTSMLQLMRYPVDVIKIDKSMTDHVHTDGTALVEALIMFCKKQGFQVTAEGVEHEEQATILRQAGVDTLQGFHLAKPQPLADLVALLQPVSDRSNAAN